MSESDPCKYDQEYINYRTVDVAERTSRALVELKPLLDAGRIVFGPTFHTSTSSGEEILIDTLATISPVHVQTQTESNVYFLLARTSFGEVVGLRKIKVLNTGEEALADGEVMTLSKVPGVGTVLELANIFLLQNEADRREKPIIDTVDAANWRRLSQIQDMIEESFHYSEKIRFYELHQRKLEEFKRWSELFGNKGFLGYKNLVKRFNPAKESVVPRIEEDVRLDRNYEQSDDGRRLMYPIVGEWVMQGDEPSKTKEEIFREGILPQLEEIASHERDEWRIFE